MNPGFKIPFVSKTSVSKGTRKDAMRFISSFESDTTRESKSIEIKDILEMPKAESLILESKLPVIFGINDRLKILSTDLVNTALLSVTYSGLHIQDALDYLSTIYTQLNLLGERFTSINVVEQCATPSIHRLKGEVLAFNENDCEGLAFLYKRAIADRIAASRTEELPKLIINVVGSQDFIEGLSKLKINVEDLKLANITFIVNCTSFNVNGISSVVYPSVSSRVGINAIPYASSEMGLTLDGEVSRMVAVLSSFESWQESVSDKDFERKNKNLPTTVVVLNGNDNEPFNPLSDADLIYPMVSHAIYNEEMINGYIEQYADTFKFLFY